jgi:hypothetical protein
LLRVVFNDLLETDTDTDWFTNHGSLTLGENHKSNTDKLAYSTVRESVDDEMDDHLDLLNEESSTTVSLSIHPYYSRRYVLVRWHCM